MKQLYSVCAFLVFCLLLTAVPGHSDWVADGAPICDATGDQEYMEMIPDGFGGAIFTWEDRRGYPDIYAQRVNQNGAPMWTANGIIVCGFSYAQYGPQIISDGAGGAVIGWYDGRPNPERDVYAQRIDAAGNALWTADGVAVCTATANQTSVRIATDGAKGVVMAWVDERSGTAMPKDIYVQRVDSLGVPMWTANGVALCTNSFNQDFPRICFDGAGGAIVAWLDYRAGTHVYAQRINATGAPQWTANGIAVCSASGTKYDLEIMSDGSGGAIIAWCDNRTWYDLYAQRIDSDGNSLWTINGAGVCVAPQQQRYPQMISDGSGGAIITWRDNRAVQTDIYVRRVDSTGDTLWATNGVMVCNQLDYQHLPYIASDGTGGAIIAWYDSRSVTPDIYSQRVNPNGSVMWAANGVAVCTVDNNQQDVRVVPDGNNGAIYGWKDQRDYATKGEDIYFSGLDSYGGIKVHTTLAHHTIEVTEAGVSILWTLSEAGEDMRFYVLRAEGAGRLFHEIPGAEVTVSGLTCEFVDGTCQTGKSYRYAVEVSDELGRRRLFETSAVSLPIPKLVLARNAPNPFCPTTTISFVLPEQSPVNLSIYDPRGRHVVTLIDDVLGEGPHKIKWDGVDQNGHLMSSGVYFYRLDTGQRALVKKMVLLK